MAVASRLIEQNYYFICFSWVMDGPVAASPNLESVLKAVDVKVGHAYT